MKQKTHSGCKKRFKVRKSGSVAVGKAADKHLLQNKSKRQKKTTEMPVNPTRMRALRRMMPGKVKINTNYNEKNVSNEETKENAKA